MRTNSPLKKLAPKLQQIINNYVAQTGERAMKSEDLLAYCEEMGDFTDNEMIIIRRLARQAWSFPPAPIAVN